MKKLFTLLSIALSSFAVANAQTQVITDPSLEAAGGGGPEWSSTSTNFGTVLCDATSCGTCGGPCVPNSGTWYAWFGGTTSAEIGTLSQSFTVATGGVGTLSFYLTIPNAGTANDSIGIAIDGNQVWAQLANDTVGFDAAYAEVTVNLGTLAAGSHNILIAAVTGPGAATVNILVDDVTVEVGGTSGTETILIDENINMYHNTAENTLYMNFLMNDEADMAVSIIDMNGRIVLVKNYNNIQNETLTLNTTGLAGGIYTVNFVKENSSAISKKIYINK